MIEVKNLTKRYGNHLAVDHLKFDRSAFDRVCGFENIDVIVTDRRPSSEWMKVFEKYGIECHYPEEEQNG